VRERRVSVLPALALAAALTGCNGALQTHNEVCSDMPGDPATPHSATNAPATHGPGIVAAAPVRLQATGGWPHKKLDVSMNVTMFPMLYVYDDEARFALGLRPSDNPVLADPVLAEAGSYGFWSEVSDNRYYELPGVTSCTQTLLLGDDFNFRAPKSGLLFVQYLTPLCANCDRVSAAIQRTLDTHPQLPARWVQYDLASTTGTWCYKGYGFEPRERVARGDVIKDYTCPK
jgi:hypothetical protein